MKLFLSLAIFLLLIGYSNKGEAQIINVCGSDSIKLCASNYQNGTVQWEESLNNIDWIDIEGANDTTYTFFPEEAKYYRAEVKFSQCPTEYSEVSYIQLPPKANAGVDRTVSNESIQLMANEQEGALGTWAILSGENGSISNVNNASAIFQGKNDIYPLVWTLSNSCGTSKDTVEITFKENEYSKNIVIVDLTDTLLSDSTQRANGFYKIKFSTPTPLVTDSTVLIGIADEGFIRKVDSLKIENDVYSIYTSQGSLTDITINGAFNLGDIEEISTTTLKSTSGYRKLDHMPTRAELITDPKFKTGRYFYVPKDEVNYISPGVSYNNSTLKSGNTNDPLIDLTFNKTIWENDNASIKLSGYYKFYPNIVVDFDIDTKWYGRPYLKSFKSGMYNGVIQKNYKIEIDASGAANLVDKSFEIFSKSKTSVFVIGTVPVVVVSKISFEGSVSADIDASMHIEHGQTHTSTYTAAIEYNSGHWDYLNAKSEQNQMDNLVEVQGNLIQEFEIGPTVSFMVYGIVGPYVDTRLTESFEICAGARATSPKLGSAGWQANLNIGGSLSVGAKAEIADINLFDVKKTWEKGFFHLQFPSKLSYISGNNQYYEKGKVLGQKITVKSLSNTGFKVPGTIVQFNPLDGGKVANSWVLTNTDGEASTYWTPGGEKTSSLEATAYDCEGNNLNKSPITIFALSSSAGLACANSNLSASLGFHKGQHWYNFNYYQLKGNLGVAPYLYSQDGSSYSTTAPKLYSSTYKYSPGDQGKTFQYYVKDNNGCIAMTSYTVGTCKNSNLALTTKITGNVLTANGTGGAGDYTYALDNLDGSYSATNTFKDLAVGSHVIYLKDASGCVDTKVEYIPFSQPPIVANFAANKKYAAAGSEVQFQDLSNNATAWSWNFGDGSTSEEQDPSHSYSGTGTYSVTLVASNATSSNTKSMNNLIQVGNIPEVHFTSLETEVELGQSISFTNQSLNGATSVVWDFGDGTSSTSNNPTHTYTKIGTFNVKLIVTNNYGTDSFTQSNYITITESPYFTDQRDGHVYKFVKIGNQTWMAENLAWMPSVNDPLRADYWEPTTNAEYYVFGYQGTDVSAAKATDNFKNYGALYNIPATQVAAPEGWHIPTKEEWQVLTDYVSNNGYTGKESNALKSCRQVNSPAGGDCSTSIHPRWDENSDTYGLDVFGFAALPGGEASGEMGEVGMMGCWWAKTTDLSATECPFFTIDSRNGEEGNAVVNDWGAPILGYSIRCIKDE